MSIQVNCYRFVYKSEDKKVVLSIDIDKTEDEYFNHEYCFTLYDQNDDFVESSYEIESLDSMYESYPKNVLDYHFNNYLKEVNLTIDQFKKELCYF